MENDIVTHPCGQAVTQEDLDFLAFAKAHRPCWFRQFEELQKRDAKKAEKAQAAS
jgi:hypothetical protein